MNYSNNYLKVGTVSYPPKLKMHRSVLMLTREQKTEVSKNTNDSALILYEYYIDKKNWKHFNPLDYASIGKALGWTASKTEKCKGMLVKAKYLLIKKDTLKDSTRIYRVLLGREIVNHYLETNELPSQEDEVIYFDKDTDECY